VKIFLVQAVVERDSKKKIVSLGCIYTAKVSVQQGLLKRQALVLALAPWYLRQ
jgi:hypothetical protein